MRHVVLNQPFQGHDLSVREFAAHIKAWLRAVCDHSKDGLIQAAP
ncbi:hypothetical protein ABN764_14250 [Paenibacillaceae sp. P-4]